MILGFLGHLFEPKIKISTTVNVIFPSSNINEKFGVSPSAVNRAIRQNSIPKRQIGKFVYVQKN